MPQYNEILTENQEGILVVTINRPKSLNALNDGVFKDLIQLFQNDIEPSAFKGVVITGSGERAFVAGADIKEFTSLDQSSAEQLSKRGQDIFAVIENFPIPVIAAVNGFALGGGCELAMACHMRVAADNARFGQPEVNLGILPGYGGTQRLAQLVGKGKALELIMTTDMVNAEEALSLGLANKICALDEVVDVAKSIIEKIATKSPLAIAASIKAINDCYDETKNGYDSEAKAFGKLAATEDFKEGASAFVEKRKPNWKRK